ncbi:hypothetical protein C8034_v012415 [Colletotrichum sidae]|uniref:Uncharacterized protein n=1 Tax=Colletotrichum sidae TaxID=1347389 RepID=A0A4R8TGY4_9PEZI|nr:hypothetical protein C8034_v012415 [Colletotrichum sidae]
MAMMPCSPRVHSPTAIAAVQCPSDRAHCLIDRGISCDHALARPDPSFSWPPLQKPVPTRRVDRRSLHRRHGARQRPLIHKNQERDAPALGFRYLPHTLPAEGGFQRKTQF